ncbi:MAG: GH32 C-terminal domain-containing protein [Planctomycetaceae bacterium]|nr:GH32 C-terminal domain-containing protein [Planctomycetaceae bacterium]
MKYHLPLILPFLFIAMSVTAADDIIIADFEGDAYADGWKVEGTAFGTGPAKGTLPNQMDVTGFLGAGLVNSFLGGDDAVGKLTSPVFVIERPYISFLIGGGGHDGLGINLIIDGQTVRTARGPNTVPGGSERLDWHDWDVSELQGKEAFIEIVDARQGGWGHINIDHIIQTNKQHAPVAVTVSLFPEKEFIHLPITMSAPITWVRVEVDGVWQQEFDCRLTISGEPDFYANLQIGQWKGKNVDLVIERLPADAETLALIAQNDEMSHEETIYTERLRPQFHFTARTGWINDPNGLLYYDGLWHLFFQHNPYSTDWGNMTWGHATSPDLLHWTEHPAALHPDKLGTIFSGGGVVDHHNTSGFQVGEHKPIVLTYTYDGPSARHGHRATQAIAYSTDGGKTFAKYENNPVIPHIIGGNRDPKVIWHEESQQWIMALYMDRDDFSLFASKNLREWEHLSDINNLENSECPDFFPLPVDGDENNVKWVFWGGDGKYLIGSFDGKEFTRETGLLRNKHGGHDYAAMTFSDAPDGRRIQLSWLNTWGNPNVFRDMPFNHQLSVPRELTLRTTPQGKVLLYTEPVAELKTLRGELTEISNITVRPTDGFLIPNKERLFDMEAVFSLGNASSLTLNVVGKTIEYNAAEKWIALDGTRAPLELAAGELRLRLVVDRTSIEMFAQDGEVQIAKVFRPDGDGFSPAIPVSAFGGDAVLESVKIWAMRSVWRR